MKKLLVLATVGLAVAAGSAFADYTWNFTADAEGWVPGDTGPGGWGMHGASLGWEANGAGDGKLVITYAGNYPATPTADDFNPVIFRFWWDAPNTWDNTMAGNGGLTGDYCVMRIRLTGEPPAVAEDPHFGRFENFLERNLAGQAWPSKNLFGSLPIGEWVTVVYYAGETNGQPAESVTLKFGTLGRQSYKWFQDGGSMEIDWIRFVDDPAPYLAWNFDTLNDIWEADLRVTGYHGLVNSRTEDGIWTMDYEADVPGGYVPTISGEQILWAPENPAHTYVRCRINCDPSLAQIQCLGVWQPGWQMYDLAGTGTTIPTNEWTTIDVHVPAGENSGWRIDFGADYFGGMSAYPALLGGTLDIDYIVMSEAALTDDTDGDTLGDVDELGMGTDPNATDSDGDGLGDAEEVNVTFTDPRLVDTDGDILPDGWEYTYGLDPLDDGSVDADNGADGDPDADGADNFAELQAGTDPQDPDSVPPRMPVAGMAGLAALALALTAAGKRALK